MNRISEPSRDPWNIGLHLAEEISLLKSSLPASDRHKNWSFAEQIEITINVERLAIENNSTSKNHTWHNLKTQQYVETQHKLKDDELKRKRKKKSVSYNSNLGGATRTYSHLQMNIQIQKVKLHFHDFSNIEKLQRYLNPSQTKTFRGSEKSL